MNSVSFRHSALNNGMLCAHKPTSKIVKWGLIPYSSESSLRKCHWPCVWAALRGSGSHYKGQHLAWCVLSQCFSALFLRLVLVLVDILEKNKNKKQKRKQHSEVKDAQKARNVNYASCAHFIFNNLESPTIQSPNIAATHNCSNLNRFEFIYIQITSLGPTSQCCHSGD